MKKVLVLMSTYNGETYLSAQLDSILFQNGVITYLYIRDDGSTDSTRQLLDKYKTMYGERVHFLVEENVGFNKSFLRLIYSASGLGDFDYYAFSDQDDVWHPDKLLKTIKAMSNEEIPQISFSNAVETNEKMEFKNYLYDKSREIPSKYMSLEISVCNGFLMVFNKALLEFVCMYKGNIPVSYDLWVGAVCLYLNGTIRYVDEVLAEHRRLPNSVSRISFWRVFKHRLHNLFHYEGREVNGAKILLDVWGDKILEDDRYFLTHVLSYKKKWKSKVFLLKHPRLKKKSFFETFLFKLKILVGRF